ncbi:MAG TPA: MBL fold metallo-hydrolase [Ramlibacter sp.]|nr:MBL fold metallo-hydrolase [Ramlibacter sp.]
MAAALSWQIGEVKVTRILEQDFELPPARLLARFSQDGLDRHSGWLKPCFQRADGQLAMSHQALVVQSRGKSIVVDTCRGNDRPLPNGRGVIHSEFLQRLETVVSRHEVDCVMCTHLHYDHVGWNTMLQDGVWVPTFPRAEYLFAQREYEHWSTSAEDINVDLNYAIDPIVRLGLHRLIEPGHRITDEVSVISTPGHTPGHVSVRIVSRGEEALITGDCAHHPIQLAEVDWSSHADVHPALAIHTRRELVSRLRNRPVLVIGTHFAAPTAGYIVGMPSATRFQTVADQEHRLEQGDSTWPSRP